MTHLEFGNEPKDPSEGDRGHASPDESDLAAHVDGFLLQIRRDERDDHACGCHQTEARDLQLAKRDERRKNRACAIKTHRSSNPMQHPTPESYLASHLQVPLPTPSRESQSTTG
jgi:hypothetical protein